MRTHQALQKKSSVKKAIAPDHALSSRPFAAQRKPTEDQRKPENKSLESTLGEFAIHNPDGGSSLPVQPKRAIGRSGDRPEPELSYLQKTNQAIGPRIQRVFTVGLGKKKEKYINLSTSIPEDIRKEIRARTPRVIKVYQVLRAWSKSTNTQNFDTWGEAIKAAIQEASQNERMSTRIHEPEPPPSPYTSSQQEEIDYLNTEGRTAEHMKDKAVWNELKIHGQLGEHGHQQELENKGILYEDANNFLGYNAPGIDTLANQKKAFGQSKMHIAEGMTVEEIANHYITHLDNSVTYAQTFLKSVLQDTPVGEKRRKSIKKTAKEWKNETLTKLVEFFDSDEWVVPKNDLSDVLDSTVENGKVKAVEPVKLVAEAMQFPVPSDVYDYLKTNFSSHINSFYQLPHTVDWYRKVKLGMKYKINKPIKTEEEKDADYV
ncbi:MAG TPA: hypothetical protein VK203_11620 [Nostocaceae cyanobacterium]|nr:hypothetical protein [Nostocaceae cyanobacterium]